MKTANIVATVLIMSALGAGGAIGMQHESSVEKGKALFNDPKLGTIGKTCNDCHKDGAGLEKAGQRKDLKNMVNGCIKASLKGKALKTKSIEMQSLVLYLKSLDGEKKPAAKKAPVGC